MALACWGASTCAVDGWDAGREGEGFASNPAAGTGCEGWRGDARREGEGFASCPAAAGTVETNEDGPEVWEDWYGCAPHAKDSAITIPTRSSAKRLDLRSQAHHAGRDRRRPCGTKEREQSTKGREQRTIGTQKSVRHGPPSCQRGLLPMRFHARLRRLVPSLPRSYQPFRCPFSIRRRR